MHLYVFLVMVFTNFGQLQAVEVSPPTPDVSLCMAARDARIESVQNPDQLVSLEDQGKSKIMVSPCFEIRSDQIPSCQ